MPAIALAHSALSLDAVRPHAKNYKIHTDRQISQLQESLVRFGQVRSVVVHDAGDGTYTTVAGHGVIEAARRLSWTHITADVLPTEWTETDIRGYLIADNQHAMAAKDDEYLLFELLQEQRDAEIDLASLGFSEQSIDDLHARLGAVSPEEFLSQEAAVPEEQELWPVISVRVPPEVKERYDAMMPKSKNEASKIVQMIEAAEQRGTDPVEMKLEEVDERDEKKGSLLSLLDITIADPRHEVETGDIWCLDNHRLLVVHVFKDWRIWKEYLKGDACLFLPFAGPLVAISESADSHTLVMVQPDTYIAGHVLDRYADIHGEGSVRKIEHVAVSAEPEPEDE